MVQWRSVLDGITSIALISAAGTLIWTSMSRNAGPPPRPELTIPSELQRLDDSAMKGNPQARVAVVGYSDFECPFCGSFARETLPVLQAKYIETGLVKFAFRHFPLPNHRFARSAAAAAECARGQGRFWEYHDALFRSQDALDEQALHRQAATLGLNEPQFADCLASSEVSLIDRDLASAKTLGVTGTPAFLIGMVEGEDGLRVTNILTGAQPASEFGKVLDDLLTGTKSVSQQR